MAIFFFIFIFLIPTQYVFSAEELQVDFQSNWTRLTDLYFENSHLSNAGTYTGYGQLRSGFATKYQTVEAYAVSRMGADSRTNLDSTGNVYNDNFIFAGVGVDYLGLFSGLRFTFQAGGSFDLSSKIHESGFDLRTGVQTYHEVSWINRSLISEIYSEGLYFQRYQNLLASGQFRTVFNAFRWTLDKSQIELGSVLNWVVAGDSAGFDYNRFVEARLGPRFTFRGPITVSLSSFYVVGGRWERPTDLPYYRDFRVLLTGYISL